jgi:hypothetical protein
VTWQAEEHNCIIAFRIRINGNKIDVDCEMEVFDEARHYVDLYLRTQDFVMVALDLLSFQTGKHHRGIIKYWISPDGACKEIYDMFPVTQENSSAVLSSPTDLPTLLPIVAGDPPLFRALRDLIDGVMTPHSSVVNCGRVVDALRKLIAPSLERKQGWEQLQTALRVERSYREPITTLSTNPRHGDFSRIKGDVTMDISLRTWNLMNRYLEFRKRGGHPLPEDEFPLLS